ncbi:thioredoxin-like protein [Chaetomium sp. MPI-SDFR-AT-0129]|nr:thioredoxin-like protein [Chaetomium sp. MPI-SDFR-AT-0129]
MPSHRRSRAITYLVLAGIITLLFISHRRADTHAVQDFYSKTVSAIDKHHLASSSSSSSSSSDHNRSPTTHDQQTDQAGQAGQKPLSGPSRPGTAAGGGYDDDDEEEDEQVLSEQRAERLREAEKKAKQNAEAKGPNKPEMPEEVVGVGSSAGGQGSVVRDDDTEGGKKKEKETSKEEREVEGELNSILKKSPVIIFSKSYCPYSKRAKGVLLEKYVIEPTPFVVELDQHPLGPRMQAKLGEMTGRRTVPNVLVYGQSIGGGDDIVALDAEKTLADKIATLGQSHIKVALRFAQTVQKVVAGGAGAAGDAPE